MVRNRSEVWNYFKVEGKRSTCNFCGKEAYKNPSRMPFHLTKCPKCPQPIRERMLAELPKSLIKSTSSPSQCQLVIPCSDVSCFHKFRMTYGNQLTTITFHFQSHLEPKIKFPRPYESFLLKFVIFQDDSPSSNDCENAEIEVLGQDEEVENVIFLPDRYKFHPKRSEESPVTTVNEDKPEDEFTLFANSVAHKLRSINNARARVIAQYYINTVLFRAEMTNFDEEISLPTPEFPLFDSVGRESTKPDGKPESNKTDV